MMPTVTCSSSCAWIVTRSWSGIWMLSCAWPTWSDSAGSASLCRISWICAGRTWSAGSWTCEMILCLLFSPQTWTGSSGEQQTWSVSAWTCVRTPCLLFSPQMLTGSSGEPWTWSVSAGTSAPTLCLLFSLQMWIGSFGEQETLSVC